MDMKRIVDVLDSTSYDPVRNQSSELEIKLTVTDYDASFARP